MEVESINKQISALKNSIEFKRLCKSRSGFEDDNRYNNYISKINLLNKLKENVPTPDSENKPEPKVEESAENLEIKRYQQLAEDIKELEQKYFALDLNVKNLEQKQEMLMINIEMLQKQKNNLDNTSEKSITEEIIQKTGIIQEREDNIFESTDRLEDEIDNKSGKKIRKKSSKKSNTVWNT
jgi:hypothetical protein